MFPDQDYRQLDRLQLVLTAVYRACEIEDHRLRAMAVQMVFYGTLFLLIVTIETLFATLLFSIIEVEVLGTAISGTAFAMMVPAVIGMVHVKLHNEGDHFTRWWLSTLSSIGIPLFCLGLSVSLGFAAWQAAEDAVGALTSAPRGTLGSQQIIAEPSASTDVAEWLAIVPNTLLFLGLSFGMIISVALASHCLGKALVAFNVWTQVPRISPWVREKVAVLLEMIADLREALEEDRAARLALPLDLNLTYARKAAHACLIVVLRKLDAARRRFAAGRGKDAMTVVFPDAEAEAIPASFSTEAAFKRHMAEVLDSTRVHNLLAQIGGLSKED